MTGKTRMLTQGLLRHWDFYFSYCAASAFSHVEPSPASQDSALALRLFEASVASAKPEDRSAISQRCFYALYLTRIVVFSELLDSLPQDLSADQARKEWLYFQLCPPRTSPDSDIFGSVFQAISTGRSEDLRSCARSRMCTAAWRHFKWFGQSFVISRTSEKPFPMAKEGNQPLFHVVVDEVMPSATMSIKLRGGRHAARRRKAVCELFWPECI